MNPVSCAKSGGSAWGAVGGGCVPMTQSGLMRAIPALLLALSSGSVPYVRAQPAGEPIAVSTEHPRLFLRPARLRMLRRERERASMRWQQFAALLAGHE